MCCVSVVRSAVVECLALKPCWVGESGMSTVMRFRLEQPASEKKEWEGPYPAFYTNSKCFTDDNSLFCRQ